MLEIMEESRFQRIRNFLTYSDKKRLIGFAVVIALIAAIPLLVKSSQQQQETRQHASGGNATKEFWQSIMDWGGEDSWYRRCPVLESTPVWAACGGWTFVDLRNLRGVGNEKYLGMDSVVIGDKLWQSFIDYNRQGSWYRRCPISNGAINWGSCTGWSNVNLKIFVVAPTKNILRSRGLY